MSNSIEKFLPAAGGTVQVPNWLDYLILTDGVSFRGVYEEVIVWIVICDQVGSSDVGSFHGKLAIG
jgi:hypothetical protein